MKRSLIYTNILILFLFSSCGGGPKLGTPYVPYPMTDTPEPTETTEAILSIPTETITGGVFTPTQTPTLVPDAWMSMPVFPAGVSPQMIEVYRRGLEMGRDPERFSKFGDCQSILPYFLGMYDSGEYRLGEEYASLQTTIDHFSGSWGRNGFALKSGMNVAAVQTLFYTDPVNCSADKSPMECEVEKFNPSIGLISFETWWAGKPAGDYEFRLRSLVDYLISQGVVPILATKADNLEGDYGINEVIARVAYEYGIPLWNYWGATYPLAGHGVIEDGFHLTGLGTHSYFDDPERMKMAWPWRNLTALQAIDAVYRGLSGGK